ncbi:ABC transporter ATP-binding protein [Psychrosphaera sp. B3R10]|uniref:ABC transporter ATP-binding protein n=1 Tax=unclassified Psychrosphaera TaxID=2641570 RepID=UPI001C0A0768|nr:MULTISPECIES: ABC transporter ATP-binding protein [unclassified Psychrosphaera]MBU2883701.1 ABC transporter ATP-binding protein [Psychrosphaera sp. I2R16]MBU2987997.1 ABC transporter ATP-binding protein [Psychrosphaera sp. B3R10]MDO6720353.1 ABC transporter ATP-binding protein [Psychrosphaera sp. 1_MG-2023]
MLNISQLYLQLGNKVLFDKADAIIYPGHKIGIVGANGSGKSTLFNLIRGELGGDDGEVSMPNSWTLAWVKQETPALAKSALEYVIDGDVKYRELQQQLEQAEQEDDGAKIAHIHHEMDLIHAYTIRSRAGELLNGLGFDTEAQQQSVMSFSGGWRMRLNLAQALMINSDLLLLDEPTNHLDLDAVIWLEKWLTRYQGTMLLISHDRDFIDNICQGILHVEAQKLNFYSGNYSNFERQRMEKLAQQQAVFQKQQTEIQHIQSFIDRFKAKASKAKQAQSRVKMLERMELIAPAHVDSQFNFEFKQPTNLPNPIIKMDKVSAGYETKTILTDIKLNLVPGSRIGLLGRNGAGKSTLIKTLSRSLAPLGGEFEHSKHLKIGYFAQHQLDTLQLGNSPIQHLIQLQDGLTEQEARNYLGGFGFNGDQALDPIDQFSGGEKARLVLALMVFQRPNLLLMDEPTNHLDIEMRHALTMALQEFEGAMILIAHDRHLLKATCDDLYLVDNGTVSPFPGDLEDYHKWLLDQQKLESIENQLSDEEPKENTAAAKKEIKRLEAEMRKEISPIKKIADKLAVKQSKLEQQLVEIEQAMSDSDLYSDKRKGELNQLLLKQGELKSELDDVEMQWFECEEQMEDIKAKFDIENV